MERDGYFLRRWGLLPMAPSWPQLKRWTASGIILVVLALVIVDAMPLIPDDLRIWSSPIARRLGIDQGQWSMFSSPDSANHRLRSELTLRDGRVIEHSFPDLTQQSAWQRFLGHRRSEYVDNAITFGQQHPAVWEGLADYHAGQYAGMGGGVSRVRIIVDLSTIPPPSGTTWQRRAQELPFDDQRVVYRRKYP